MHYQTRVRKLNQSKGAPLLERARRAEQESRELRQSLSKSQKTLEDFRASGLEALRQSVRATTDPAMGGIQRVLLCKIEITYAAIKHLSLSIGAKHRILDEVIKEASRVLDSFGII